MFSGINPTHSVARVSGFCLEGTENADVQSIVAIETWLVFYRFSLILYAWLTPMIFPVVVFNFKNLSNLYFHRKNYSCHLGLSDQVHGYLDVYTCAYEAHGYLDVCMCIYEGQGRVASVLLCYSAFASK